MSPGLIYKIDCSTSMLQPGYVNSGNGCGLVLYEGAEMWSRDMILILGETTSIDLFRARSLRACEVLDAQQTSDPKLHISVVARSLTTISSVSSTQIDPFRARLLRAC